MPKPSRVQPPRYQLRAVQILVILTPLVYWSTLRDYTLAPKLLVLQGTLAFILASWLISGATSFRLPDLGRPALAYVLINAVSVLYATDRIAGLLELSKILSGFLLFVLIANRLRTPDIPRILRACTLTGGAVSLLGIAQHLGWQPLHIPSAGLPSATLGYRNLAASYLIQTIPLTIGLFARSRSRAWTWIAVLSAALMLFFLICTRTRGAWVGLAGSVVLTAILLIFAYRDHRPFIPKNKIVPAMAALILVLIMVRFLPSNLAKIGPQSIDEKKADLATAASSFLQEGGDRGRFAMWRHTLEMAAAHPFLGVGLGNWSVHYVRYDRGERVTFNAAPERPHNDLLWILSETGGIGLLCYLWLGILALRAAWSALRSPNARTRTLTAAALASCAAIVGHSLFSFPRERISPTVFFWLTLGFLALLTPRARTASGRAIRPTLVLALLLVLLQILFTSRLWRFDSHVHRAVLAEKRGNWKTTAAETDAALNAGPFHTEAVHLRGYALNQTGDFDASRRLYADALRRRPYDIQMLNGMAIACQNLGDLDAAQTCYQRALALVSDLTDVRYNLAGLYLKMNRPEAAAEEFQAVLNWEGASADLYYNLGRARDMSGQTEAALDAYRAFLEHWKGDPRYARIVRARIAELTPKRTP